MYGPFTKMSHQEPKQTVRITKSKIKKIGKISPKIPIEYLIEGYCSYNKNANLLISLAQTQNLSASQESGKRGSSVPLVSLVRMDSDIWHFLLILQQ